MDSYKIVRHRFDGENTVEQTGLTLEEAQAHCQRDDTSGDGWFDGYTLENPSDEVLAERAEADDRLRRMVDISRRIGS
jgi:hypothetical protein